MVVINGNFIKANDFGIKLAEKLCLGWNLKVVLTDEFWNGYLLFESNNSVPAIVEFENFNTFDEVTVRYNQLGEIIKEY